MSKASYIQKTYSAPLLQSEEENSLLHTLGEVLGKIRNNDYIYLAQCTKEGIKTTNNLRRKRLTSKYLISTREADSIVYANSEQLDLVKRTTESNIEDWHKDIEKYRKKFYDSSHPYQRRYFAGLIQSIESKINRAKSKTPSCCFGGAKLQRQVTLHPYDSDIRQEWINKRLFLSFMGNSNRSHGNDIIKYHPDTGILVAQISHGLQALCGFSDRKITLGKAVFKFGFSAIKKSIDLKTSTYHSIKWNHNKKQWYLHTTVRLSKDEQEENLKKKISQCPVKEKTRICGIDQNSGFINATIIDGHGNPVSRITIPHRHSRDIAALVDKLVTWAINNGVKRFAIEKLSGLNYKKRKSNGNGAGLNKIVSTIPFGEFKSRITSTAATYGLEVKEVSPYHTSKNTVQWTEDIFGTTTHEKASYLIARRLLGLSITRRNLRARHPKDNRVCPRAITSSYGSVLRNPHDKTSLYKDVCVVNCGT